MESVYSQDLIAISILATDFSVIQQCGPMVISQSHHVRNIQ